MSRSKPGNLLLRRESQDAAPPRAATRAQRDAHRPMCYREELSRAKRTGAAAGKRARRGRACCEAAAGWVPRTGEAGTPRLLLCGVQARA